MLGIPGYSSDDDEDKPMFGPVFLSPMASTIMRNWYATAQNRLGKIPGRRRRVAPSEVVISDDESGDENVAIWAKRPLQVTPASQEIIRNWLSSARSRIQTRGDSTQNRQRTAATVVEGRRKPGKGPTSRVVRK